MMTTGQEGQPELPESLRSLKREIDEAWARGDAGRVLPLLRRLIAEAERDAALQELWAASQQAVGDALMQSVAGGEHGVQEAIDAYRAALRVYTRDAFPAEYATVHNNLGNAYRELPSADLEEHEANLDQAVAAYQAALTVRTREVDPYGWARTQNNLGNAHAERLRDRAAHQPLAIAAFQAALEVHDIVRYPQDYAMDLTNLGLTHQEQEGGVRLVNLDRAMACFVRAMLVHTPFEAPRRHQRLVGSLGDAFVERMALTPSKLQPEVVTALVPVVQALAEARYPPEMPAGTAASDAGEPDGDADSWLPDPDLFSSYQRDGYRVMPLHQLLDLATSAESGEDPEFRVELLRVATERPDVVLPKLRAQLLDELGVALLGLPSGANTAAFQEEAIEALEAALDACPHDEDPHAWGTIRNHLAAAYGDRLSGDRAGNMECALEHGVAALSTRPEGSPEWALFTAQLGQLYRDRRLGDPRRNCDEAVACFEAALRVWTKKSWPYEWARTKNSLGHALTGLRPGDAQALDAAIRAYEEALTVLTEKRHPYEWAGVTTNLSIALVNRTIGDRKRDVERAIKGHLAALAVRTRERHPDDWAHTQHNLGAAYRVRLAGAKDDNLRLAAEHFRAALEELTLDGRPSDHRATAGALGEVEAARGRWLAAHEAFASAAAAGDLLLAGITTGPHGFDDVVRQGHEVGELDAYVLSRLGRLEEAVEAVERGRTRWIAKSLADAVGAPVTVADIASGAGRPVVYLLASQWGGLALAIRETADEPEVLSWDLPGLTDKFVGDLVQQTLPDGSGRIVGGYGAAQEGSGLNWLMHQWPGATFAEKATQLHAACHAAAVDGTLDAAAQDVLALAHPGLAELLRTPVGSLPPADLSRLTATLHHALLRSELPRCLAGLAEVVTKPLAVALSEHGVASMALIPCGLLPGLPVTAAAVDGDTTLADRLVVTVAPSARALLEWPSRAAGDGDGVYTLGDPRPTHQELRWGEAEALTVAELAGNPRRARVREAATRTWLTESLRAGQVVLTSCHGEFDGRDFLRSRLLLANGDDLTLGELLEDQESFAGLRALIMSACQTAVMDIRGAHGEVRSLATGMLRAGVRAVVAPLWAVDDRATYLLMVRFAQEWLPRLGREGPSAALTRAQSWLRRVTQRELAAWEIRTGVAGAAHAPAAVRGRGTRYTVAEAEHLTAGFARHGAAEDPGSTPYADPVFWAAFQVHGQ